MTLSLPIFSLMAMFSLRAPSLELVDSNAHPSQLIAILQTPFERIFISGIVSTLFQPDMCLKTQVI